MCRCRRDGGWSRRCATFDLRLVASGHVHQRRDFTFGRTRHVWSPSTGFIISDAKQERIGLKEVGLVEYRVRLILSDYRREG